MNADILQLADEIVSLIQSNLGSGDTSSVQRMYETERDLGEFTQRQIDVYPLRYERGEPQTRLEDVFYAYIGVVVSERYSLPQEQDLITVPISWVDERVNFVEQIFNLLQAARVQIQVGSMPYLWVCDSASVETTYDYRYLKQHKVFWSELEFGFMTLKIGETE